MEGREVSKLDKTIVSLFTKERILSLMHSYIIFDAKTKKIARYQQFFAVEKIMQRVQKLHYARALKLALSSDKIEEIFSEKEISNFRQKLKFYNELRKAVKIRYHEIVDFGKYEKQMQKLLDTFISADEVGQLTKLVNIFDAEFDAEIERMVGDNARADAILSASTATIRERMESNPAYYEKLSLRIKEILEEYKDKRLSEEEKLKQAKDIRKMLLSSDEEEEEGKYPEPLKHNVQAKAFYDNLSNYFSMVAEAMPTYGNKTSEDVLSKVVLKIDQMFSEASKRLFAGFCEGQIKQTS